MPKAIIKIEYKQIIDASSPSSFEKNIFNYSYEEYKLKQQAYNADGSIKTFAALKEKDGRANSLHYKSGFAVAGFIDLLKNKITVQQDDYEMPFQFESYRFEVIASDITDKTKHKVAVNYISGPLTLFEVIGNYLLVANGNISDPSLGDETKTYLIKVQPGVNIISYEEIKEQSSIIN